jgi:hypothetical protein
MQMNPTVILAISLFLAAGFSAAAEPETGGPRKPVSAVPS